MTWYRVTTSTIYTSEGTLEPGDYIEDPPESVLEGFSDNLVEDEPDSAAEVESEESRPAIEAEEAPNHGPGTQGDTEDPAEADDAATPGEGEEGGEESATGEPDTGTDTEAEDTESSDESVVPDDYDSFNVSEVREWLDSTDLSDEDLETVKEYEASQKDRTTVKNEIDERRSAE